jgi:Tol biopolymer transport system component
MARGRTLYLPVMIAAAVLAACAVVLLAVSGKAGATFPGKNGRIAYSAFVERTTGDAIYTIAPGGAGKTKVTRGYLPSSSPNGKRIAHSLYKPNNIFQSDIYTIDASGGGRIRVTNTDNAFVRGPSWGSRP